MSSEATPVQPSILKQLHQACYTGTTAEVCTLLQNYPQLINQPDTDGNMPIHIAAQLHRSDLISSLLDRSARIDQPNNAGNCPIHLIAIGVTRDRSKKTNPMQDR